MEPSNSTFDSALFRKRDKAIEEKHVKEKDALNHKIQRLKRSNDETLKDLFDLRNRCDRLARSLGFKDLPDAQATVDAVDTVLLYKEFLERHEQLENDLLAERGKNEDLHETITALKQEQERLKADVASAARNSQRAQSDAQRQQVRAERISSELGHLQSRYDTLSNVRGRCAMQYKKDYTAWKNFRDWLFDESGLEGLELSSKEKRSKMNALVKERKEIIKQSHSRNEPSASAPHPPLGGTEAPSSEDREDLSTPQRKRKLSSGGTPPLHISQEDAPPLSPQRSASKPAIIEIPSSSPTVFNADSAPRNSSGSTRRPLSFEPIAKLNLQKWTPTSRPSSSSHPKSSQTEPESPEPSPASKENHVPTSPTTSPGHMASSQTEPESQSQIFPFPPTFPSKSTPRPLIMMNMVPRTAPTRFGGAVVSRDPETLRPIKMQKLGDPPATSPRRRQPWLPAASTNSSTPMQSRTLFGSKENRPFLVPTLTPMNPPKDSNPKAGDYSAFKGRGRYAKEVKSGKNTINAQYVIDPEQNGGVNFQFDEVVRNKRERQQMDAGNCDCCRGYYEAVGPLPSRMQAPLWRSPKKNKPSGHSPNCKHHASNSKLDEVAFEDNSDMLDDPKIEAHQKAISRHRHHWARANTPPGYWEIGFPNTQEAEDINEKAKEMHVKKRQEIDAAAKREGGRYRRRD